jgi:hypothetical protein
MYKDKKVRPAKDTGYYVSTAHSLWTFGIYRTARMTAWEAFEAIVDDVAVRLVTYCYSRKTKGRIDRRRVRVAATNEIWGEQVNGPRTRYNLEARESYPDVDAPP